MRAMSRAELCALPSREIIALLEPPYTLKPTSLTFAAEIAGPQMTVEEAQRLLFPLARDHDKPYVREGAVYGLEPHLRHPAVQAFLRERLTVDTSRGVRASIRETLRGGAR